MARTSGGAATKSTISAWMTCTICTGVPVDGLHAGRSRVQRAEQQPGRHHAARPAEAEQRHGDRVDPVGAVALRVEGEVGAEDDRGAGQPGEPAADQHHQRPVALHVHPGDAGGAGVRADAAELEPGRGPVEQPPHPERGRPARSGSRR